MPRDHARIYLSVWDDGDFLALPSHAQHAYWLLVSQPWLTWVGVMTYSPATLAELSADLTEAKIARSVAVLKAQRFVLVDDRTHEVLIRSYVRRDGVMDRANMGKAVARALDKVMSTQLQDAIQQELARLHFKEPSLAGWVGFKAIDPARYEVVVGIASRMQSGM